MSPRFGALIVGRGRGVVNHARARSSRAGAAALGLLVLLMLAAPVRLHANCGAESCPLDNSAFSARPRRFSLEVSFLAVDQDQVRVGTTPSDHTEAFTSGGEVRTHSQITTTRALWSVTPRVLLSASLPYVWRLHSHTTFTGVPVPELRTWEYGGLGDLVLLASGSLWQTPPDPTSLSFGVQGGIKLPTGREHVPTIDGEEPEAHARPGTGSTDFLAGAHLVQSVPVPSPSGNPSVLFASVFYTHTGYGVDDYRLGRMTETHWGASYPLVQRVGVLAQFSTQSRGRDRTAVPSGGGEHAGHEGDEESGVHPNTGGFAMFAAPGLLFQVTPLLAVSTYVQIPVYQRVNGTQLVAPAQFWMSTTYRLP